MTQHEHRRIALQLASQLPDSFEDAMLVLRYARELVENFFAEQVPARPVLAFRKEES